MVLRTMRPLSIQLSQSSRVNVSGFLPTERKLTKKPEYPSVKVVAVIEPDSLANLVTNLSVANCANSKDAYLTCSKYKK